MQPRGSPWPTILGVVALILAILGGIAAVLDANWAIAGYYPIAALVIALATIGLRGAAGSIGLVFARVLTAGLVFVNLVLFAMLAFSEVACGCSSPMPPPVTPTWLLMRGLHMAGAYGAAALLGAAAVAQAREEVRAIRSARASAARANGTF
jgi:hypothetical protein